jgi:hypothetical protein
MSVGELRWSAAACLVFATTSLVSVVSGEQLEAVRRTKELAQVSPGAAELVGQISAAYQRLPAYADEAVVKVTVKGDGKPLSRTRHSALQFVREKKLLAINCGPLFVCNSPKRLEIVDFANRRVLVGPASRGWQFEPQNFAVEERNKNKPVIELREEAYRPETKPFLLLGAVSAHVTAVPLLMLIHPEPLDVLRQDPTAIDVGENQVVDDRNCNTLLFKDSYGAEWRLLCDAETKLFHRIDVEWGGKQIEVLQVKDLGVESVRFVWEPGEISRDAEEVERRFARRMQFHMRGSKSYERAELMAGFAPNEVLAPVPPGDGSLVGMVRRVIRWLVEG